MTVECGFPWTWSHGWHWTRRLTLNHMVDIENLMVEVDDVMSRWYFKRKIKVPPQGTLTLRFKRHLAITSSTSTIWFSRSTMWFKFNNLVQGQPRDQVQGNPHSTVIFYDVKIAAGRHLEWDIPNSFYCCCCTIISDHRFVTLHRIGTGRLRRILCIPLIWHDWTSTHFSK
jgi:3',5'-cyclic AMP phosphodiesterase CpdA